MRSGLLAEQRVYPQPPSNQPTMPSAASTSTTASTCALSIRTACRPWPSAPRHTLSYRDVPVVRAAGQAQSVAVVTGALPAIHVVNQKRLPSWGGYDICMSFGGRAEGVARCRPSARRPPLSSGCHAWP